MTIIGVTVNLHNTLSVQE